MRAAIFNKVGAPLEVVEMPEPVPGTGEVLLKVGRCGICGSDLHMTEPGNINPACGSVIGHEFAGEIVALGRDVTAFKIGDRVAALPIKGCGQCPACKAGEPSWCVNGLDFLAGGYAQYARAGARECLKLPADLSIADGALVEPLAVALHGARMVADLKDATVTVIGAGPIGIGAVFWAKRLGARLVQVVEGNSFRAQMAMEMGADKIFTPPSPDKGGDPAAAPVAADIVFECVGKPGLLLASLRNVRPRGTVISLGYCMGQETFMAAAAAQIEVTMKFPTLYTIDDFRTTLDTFEQGSVEPRRMITEIVDFKQLPDVFESLKKPGIQCKVMIDPWA